MDCHPNTFLESRGLRHSWRTWWMTIDWLTEEHLVWGWMDVCWGESGRCEVEWVCWGESGRTEMNMWNMVQGWVEGSQFNQKRTGTWWKCVLCLRWKSVSVECGNGRLKNGWCERWLKGISRMQNVHCARLWVVNNYNRSGSRSMYIAWQGERWIDDCRLCEDEDSEGCEMVHWRRRWVMGTTVHGWRMCKVERLDVEGRDLMMR